MSYGRLLVTGGSGYLGAELVRQALAQGWEVIATSFRRPVQAAAHYVALDVRDAAAVERTLDDLRPDVVIHTAYRQDGPDLWATTTEGAGVVARAARRVGARLIHMSSDVIFDGERAGCYTERDEPNPITPYGRAKAAAEQLVAAAHADALIARTSLIYGGAELSKHEQFVLDAANAGAEVTFYTDELRCPITVGDLASALLELAPTAVRGPLNLAGADVVSRYEFACLVAAAHGRSLEYLRAGPSPTSGQRRPQNCALDSGLAQRLLQTRLRGIREVLQH